MYITSIRIQSIFKNDIAECTSQIVRKPRLTLLKIVVNRFHKCPHSSPPYPSDLIKCTYSSLSSISFHSYPLTCPICLSLSLSSLNPIFDENDNHEFIIDVAILGGEVSTNENNLFTTLPKALGSEIVHVYELRQRMAAWFLKDLRFMGIMEKEAVHNTIRHIYSSNLMNDWGIHIVQEVNLLAKKED
ncbi:hypothetical protein Fmac_024793 [Flemingia macrophylla]|uniref:Uncharacterized protein n=1 Tax=Flemingia macrophylla TaxID=520843 RepID=A0ABD1LQE4_9FABA